MALATVRYAGYCSVPWCTGYTRTPDLHHAPHLPPLCRQSILKHLHHAPFFQNGAKSGFEMWFDIGSRHLGCWGQNTSRIQNKEVYATLCLQATCDGKPLTAVTPGQLITNYHIVPPFFQTCAKSGFAMWFGPSTLGAGAKTRLESKIKKLTPHCICRPWPGVLADDHLPLFRAHRCVRPFGTPRIPTLDSAPPLARL